jgi:hypothetical protein
VIVNYWIDPRSDGVDSSVQHVISP